MQTKTQSFNVARLKILQISIFLLLPMLVLFQNFVRKPSESIVYDEALGQCVQIKGGVRTYGYQGASPMDPCPLLIGANLKEKSFKGLKVTGMTWIAVQAEKVSFESAQMNGVRANASQIQEANFDQAQMKNSEFYRSNLNNSHFAAAHIEQTSFNAKDLSLKSNAAAEQDVKNPLQLNSSDFSQSQLADVAFYNVEMQAANFQGAHLEFKGRIPKIIQGKNFSNMFEGVRAVRSNFSRSRISGQIVSSKFDAADFQGSHILHTKIEDASFAQANLANLQIEQVTVCGNVDFSGANLRSSSWRNVQLSRHCQKSKSTLVDLSGSHLEGADLQALSLGDNLKFFNFKGATFSRSSRLPFDEKTALKLGMKKVAL